MHSEQALNAYRSLLKENALPEKWNFLQHTSDVASTDFGEVKFNSSKKFNSKVNLVFFYDTNRYIMVIVPFFTGFYQKS
jgi:hypothetical protein